MFGASIVPQHEEPEQLEEERIVQLEVDEAEQPLQMFLELELEENVEDEQLQTHQMFQEQMEEEVQRLEEEEE